MSSRVNAKVAPRKRISAPARRELIERAATELFAERGYHAASMDEIARRSGVSVPVVYDHFSSKQDLHSRLLERHFAELREVWRRQLAGGDPPVQRVARAINAWFSYVESHPFAWRMLFRDTTGEPDVETLHRDVAERSRQLLFPVVARELGVGYSPLALEMAVVAVRGVLQGLALWWYEHPETPRSEIVTAAMNAVWIGFERVREGNTWQSAGRG